MALSSDELAVMRKVFGDVDGDNSGKVRAL
jgi:hypothetical protein